jgi:hypothetical protein
MRPIPIEKCVVMNVQSNVLSVFSATAGDAMMFSPREKVKWAS